MLILGLGHKARHGKDTFAAAVKAAHPGVDIRLLSFADPLRNEVRESATEMFYNTFPKTAAFNPELALRMLCHMCGVEFEENAPVDALYPWGKQRRLHQWWGTEFRRAEDPDYWVKQAREAIEEARLDGASVVIFTDLRFPNEFEMLGEVGGTRIKMSRLGYVSDVPEHVSETALDNHVFEFLLGVKDGSLELLKRLSVQLFNLIYSTQTVTVHL